MSNTTEGLAPLSHIKENLDRVLGKGVWKSWELETISLELDMVFDELTRDKINLLQTLEISPELFTEDMAFFLHAVEVMNNKVADFERLPMPTSLELAYALDEAKKLNIPLQLLSDEKNDITDVVSYLLREEGYSKPVYPFKFVPAQLLVEGQTEEDTEAKKRAIASYIKEMNKL